MAPLGGYRQSPVGTDTDLSQLQHGSWVTFHGFLELFGANVFNPGFFGARPALEIVFVAIHLAGAILAVWALGVGLVRVFSPGELVVPVFAVAIVANLGAYMISTHAQHLLGAREMAAVLPFGAALCELRRHGRPRLMGGHAAVRAAHVRPAGPDLSRRRFHGSGLEHERAGQAGQVGLSLRRRPRLCHMYRMRRLATTASAGSTQAAIVPR